MKHFHSCWCCLLLLGLSWSPLWAAETGYRLDRAQIRITDIESLRRGANIFATNCLSCHSLGYMRYNRIGKDLGWTNDELRQNVMLYGGGIYDPIITPLAEDAALDAYGVVPPDLTLRARLRSPDWLLSYLKGFYRDADRPSGFNNAIFADTAMPNILTSLQGIQEPVYTEIHGEQQLTGLKTVIPGTLNRKEFHNQMSDLVNFMDYVSEPAKLQRVRLGWKVLLFLFVLIILSYLVKREYWKDIK